MPKKIVKSFPSTDMSKLYRDTVNSLYAWFKQEIVLYPDICLTETEYNRGVDALAEPYKSLLDYAFQKWLYAYKYELSYSQTCSAFFAAAEEFGKLKVQ